MCTLLGGYGDSVNFLNILRLYHFVYKYFIERVFVFISDSDRRVIKVAGIEVSNKSILLTYILTLKTQSITKKTQQSNMKEHLMSIPQTITLSWN